MAAFEASLSGARQGLIGLKSNDLRGAERHTETNATTGRRLLIRFCVWTSLSAAQSSLWSLSRSGLFGLRRTCSEAAATSFRRPVI